MTKKTYTHWFQNELEKIDRQIQGLTKSKVPKEELWQQRN